MENGKLKSKRGVSTVQESSPHYQFSIINSQLPMGYKRTEVGVIPEEWQIRKIKSLAEISTGKRNTQDRIDDGIYPFFVRSQNVEHINNFSFDGEAVLTAGDGVGTGKVYHYINGKFDFHQRVYRICHFNSELDGRFFYYYFSTHFYNRINAMTAKTSVDSVRMEMISGMQIPLPPFSEQRTIAEALSDADALVASLDALIAKKRAMKAGAMEELLSGRKRLPGFHGSRAEKKFSKLFDFFGGFSATREQLSDEGFCYLHYGDIHKSSQTYIDTKENFVAIPKLAVSLKRIASESLLHEGDVVFVDASEDAAGTSKHWVVSNEEDIPFISGLHTIIARSKKDDLDNKFKRYCFQCEKIKAQFQSYAVGTKVLGINKTSIGEIVLSYSTDLPEQRAIAALLSDMDAEIAALEARRDKAKLIKEGMMEALLTGRIRLVDAEATTSTIRKKKVTPADGQPRGHSRNFNDAVLIAVLTRRFGDLEHPLGHVRCQKMAYLFYRHTEKVATGFLKKAAGPYNPSTKYGGAEAIAKRRGYIVDRASGPLKGFGVGENNDEAFGYFERWYGEDALAWLERLHYEKKETLELWATVDMAMQELAEAKEEVSVEAVKGIIQSDPEWLPKLDRVIFSDENIAKAIAKSRELFG